LLRTRQGHPDTASAVANDRLGNRHRAEPPTFKLAGHLVTPLLHQTGPIPVSFFQREERSQIIGVYPISSSDIKSGNTVKLMDFDQKLQGMFRDFFDTDVVKDALQKSPLDAGTKPFCIELLMFRQIKKIEQLFARDAG